MIKPKHFDYFACPDCGAPMKSFEVKTYDGQIQRHVNGGIWETMIFACGRTDAFIPNFEQIEVLQLCGKSPKVIEIKMRRTATVEAVKKLVNTIEVDDEFRQRVLQNVKYLV